MREMVKLILALPLFLSLTEAKAQTFEELINENKVDSFAFYKTPNSITTFLFWTKQNIYYISKEVLKQNDKMVETVVIQTFSPLSFYFLNEKDINNSTIRPFTYLKNSSPTKQDTFTLSIAHNPRYEWTINQGKGFNTISLKTFELWEGSIQNETNIYSVYNNSQPIALFFRKTEELLNQIGWTK